MSHPTTAEPETPRLTPAVQTLIAINFAMIVVQLAGVPYSDIATWFGFDSTALPGRWWTIVSYMFVHAGVLHLMANMYALYLFGPRVDQAGAPKSSRHSICSADWAASH
jgi:rhomboid protease GluP